MSGQPRRAIVLVADACGVGALPDAADYGDEGTNTLAHVAEAVGGLELPTLAALGLGSIVPLRGVPAAADPVIHGRLHPLGPGKDSATGHWELMGVVLERPLPTYPHGFPAERASRRLQQAMGHEVICNRPSNGITAIEDFGSEHLRTGALILYTSQDSVLQLAAHVERVPVEELYRACAAAREAMSGEHAVGRVIARPFTGAEGAFERTPGRRDFAVRPPGRSYLQELQSAGVEVHGSARSQTCSPASASRDRTRRHQRRALESRRGAAAELDSGLVFANLIETDQDYGHRKDVAGFARALQEIDSAVGPPAGAHPRRRPSHRDGRSRRGPGPSGTDHTREYAPLLAARGRCCAGGAPGSEERTPVTTARSPTSARAPCAGCPAKTRTSCPEVPS